MEGSEIPKVASEHLGPQPLPEISHCDCAGVNCTQKKAWRPLDRDFVCSRQQIMGFNVMGFHVDILIFLGSNLS